jgi:hypothetical protein
MSIRYRNPETETLQISRGDWLLVKKHLTAGEQKRMFRRMIDPGGGIDPVNVGTSKLVTYVLDWSIDDASGKRVPLLDQDDTAKAAAFDNLPSDDFREILNAVEAHEAKMDAERSAEKNSLDGVSTSSPISPSANTSAGGDMTT